MGTKIPGGVRWGTIPNDVRKLIRKTERETDGQTGRDRESCFNGKYIQIKLSICEVMLTEIC